MILALWQWSGTKPVVPLRSAFRHRQFQHVETSAGKECAQAQESHWNQELGRICIIQKTRNGQGASLVAQWYRICLPIRETWVRSLVWDDPACLGATEPMHHSYWGCALECRDHRTASVQPTSWNCWNLQALEPVLHNKRSHCNEKPAHCAP